MLQSFIIEKHCELVKVCAFNQWLRVRGFETQEGFPFNAIYFCVFYLMTIVHVVFDMIANYNKRFYSFKKEEKKKKVF